MKLIVNPWAFPLIFFLGATAVLADPYLEAGLAATDRQWRGDDYSDFAAAIQSRKVPLPRLTEPEGQKILNRFCSTENLALNRNKSVPLAGRMQDYLAVLSNAGLVFNAYVAEVAKGVKLNDELTDVMIFQLELATLGIELVDEFLPTIEKDEKYEIRMKGLQKMRSGLTTVFVGMQRSLVDDDVLSSANKTALLKGMAKGAPSFAKVFSPDVKAELRMKFQSMQTALTSEADTTSINAILKAFSN